MHDEILNVAQQKLLPLMAQFKREYYLVGGTAIALHIGHRRSVDFDMFKPTEIEVMFGNVFRIPSLLSLAAMKAYALGRRSKWKDYVDLYFLLTQHFQMSEVTEKAIAIFGDLFSEKLFRAQLSYFADIDYTEEVEYLVAVPPSNEEIKAMLTQIALDGVM